MVLKPQDIVVALKLCSYKSQRPSIARISVQLEMSPSEVHGAIKRCQASRLIHGPEMSERPNIKALEEFLIHGVKYSFPAKHGDVTRGIPTSYGAEPLRSLITQGNEAPPVWPYAEGGQRGPLLEPLYPTVPLSALQDPFLYECLSLVDAIRDGRTRERNIAEKELVKRLDASRHEKP